MPSINVLNKMQIKQNGVNKVYQLGTVNGYYNPVDGKFYEESTHVTEIAGAPNLVYADIAGNALYIYKTSTSSFVKVSSSGGGTANDNLKFGYLNESDGKFYEDSSYTVEITGNVDYLFIGLDNDTIYRYDATNTEFISVGGGSSAGGTIEGYYNESDGKFYEESTYTTEITGAAGYLYVDLATNTTYRYDVTRAEFVVVGGGGSGLPEIIHVNSLPVAGSIENKIYEYGHMGDTYEMTNTGASAIDDIPCFEESTEVDNTYNVKAGYDIAVGDKAVDYLIFDDTTDKFTIHFKDTTTSDIDYEATVTFTVINNIQYYLGDETNQVYEQLNDYSAGDFINISAEHRISTTDFVGTQAQWDALPAAQKANYDFIHITDDVSPITYKPGHSISDGTVEKTQRDKLVFDGFTVTDDSTNEQTKIAEVPYTAGDGIDITNKEVSVSDEISRTWTGTVEEWNAIVDKSPYDGWIINLTNDPAMAGQPVVDVVANGNMNAVTSNAVYDYVDTMITQALNAGY